MTNAIAIRSRRIGEGHPAYLVAEISANHHQRLDDAIALIHAAKAAGADAVKLQTYTPDTLTIRSDNEPFRIRGTLWENRNLYDLYAEAYTPWEWHSDLFRTAREAEIEIFSSPFDASAVDLLEELDAPAYKIASFELVDLELIRCAARTGKPIILSTGMATLAEIEEAVAAAREAGAREIALLKCNSAYPAPPELMNLRTIPHMAQAFQVPVGLSDHTLGTTVAVAAVALGASLIEKHFTLSRQTPGPDSAFSLEPDEFAEMARNVRTTEAALGEVRYQPTEPEHASRVFRRSLFAVEDIRAGETLTRANIRCIRPGYGLPPRNLPHVLGMHAATNIPRGTPLSWDLLRKGPAES